MEVIDSHKRGPQTIFTVKKGERVWIVSREELPDEVFKNWRRKQARECMQRKRAEKKKTECEANVSANNSTNEQSSNLAANEEPSQVLNQQVDTRTFKSEGIQVDYKAAERAIGMITCKVCHDAEVKKLLKPCGHLVVCTDCLLKVQANGNRCPMCRELIMDHFGAFLNE